MGSNPTGGTRSPGRRRFLAGEGGVRKLGAMPGDLKVGLAFLIPIGLITLGMVLAIVLAAPKAH